MGANVAFVGDQDGDGVVDVAASCLPPSAQSVRLLSGHDGSTIRTFTVNEPEIRIASMPDLDGDSVPELLLGFGLHVDGGAMKGMAQILSGATGSEILHVLGDDDGDFLGLGVGALSDVDGDGVPDFFAGAACYANGKNGYVRAYSGATAAILWQRDGAAVDDEFGIGAAAMGDLDGDGLPDLAAGSRLHGSASGYVRLLSGATGATLRSISPPKGASLFFGGTLADAGDVDGDGIDDLLVQDIQFSTGLFQTFGAVFLESGATGAEIRRHLGSSAEVVMFGVAGLGDVNGDGRADYAFASQILSPDPFSFFQQVRLFSGSSGRSLHRLQALETDTLYGSGLAGGADLDGDGRPDLAIGARYDGLAVYGGLVELRLGNDLYLNADPDVASGGDLVTLTTREGVPGNLTIDAIVELNGAPTFILLAGVGTFDATGTRTLAGSAPSGLAGTSIVFRAFANDAAGHLIDSAPELLEFQ